MNEPHEKRLRRGLEDLSPLFQRSSSQAVIDPPSVEVSFDVQFLTVCIPENEGDAFLANAYLASQMVRRAPLVSSLVSIAPGFNAAPASSNGNGRLPSFEVLDTRISRFSLSHQELWGLTQNGKPASNSGTEPGAGKEPALASPCLVFLDFEPQQFHSLSRIALLLDRVVLFVQPEVESLREAYRLVKMFSSHNREIEFLLLFRGKGLSRDAEEFLFERFSLITSRFLGIFPGWMGELPFPERGGRAPLSSDEGFGFHPEPLVGAQGLRRPLSPEKFRFWERLQKVLRPQFPNEPHA